jgi:hypothetical protein
MVVAVLGLGEVGEQTVHALHLVADEPHIATDAAEQLRLVHQQGAQPAQQRVHRALRHARHTVSLSFFFAKDSKEREYVDIEQMNESMISHE